MTDLRALLTADLIDALDCFVRERIEEARLAQPTGKPWLTIAEAAEYVSASPRTIQRLANPKDGILRTTGLGRHRLVARADLDALLERRK